MIPLRRRARRACPFRKGRHARCIWCQTIEAEMRGLVREAARLLIPEARLVVLVAYGLAPRRRRKP